MYKLIIVDDEEEVRQGIIQKIEWDKFNFEVVGAAENGREALDLIEENIPDVVITDISMPLMDGLELAAVLRDSFPTVKTVILTGFDDFKFAQQAIKYEVADYILKPVLPKDIDDLLAKLKSQLDNEIAQKEDIKKLRQHYNESLPILRDKFLTLLITSKYIINKLEKRVSYFHLCLNGSEFIVAAATIDSNNFKDKNYEEDYFELMKFAVLNISREIVCKYSLGEVFFHDDNLVIIAGFDEGNKTTIINRSFSLLEEIRQNVEKYLKITITIGLGSICNSISKLKDSYEFALSALEYKQVIGCNKVIFIEDLEPQSIDNIVFDENKERMLVSSIKFGSEKDVSKSVNTLFTDIAGIKSSFKEYQLYLMEILAAISKLSRHFELDIGCILGVNSNLYVEISKFSTLNEAKNWIEEICIKLMNHLSDKRQNTTKILLEKAKDYIIHNYYDDELSIQKLANYLHISSCYLSMIFKKEAGETFLKYLVSVRLNEAKELLSNSDLKTSEIAERVGYPDLNYFSYFFKKNCGMSPREYKNKFFHKRGLELEK
jgi:two-component system, response regulator YesN